MSVFYGYTYIHTGNAIHTAMQALLQLARRVCFRGGLQERWIRDLLEILRWKTGVVLKAEVRGLLGPVRGNHSKRGHHALCRAYIEHGKRMDALVTPLEV